MIDENSTSTSTVFDKCFNETTNQTVSTQEFETTCDEKSIINLTAEKSADGEIPKTYSALIQLDVATGGRVNKNSSSYLEMVAKNPSTPVELASSKVFTGQTSFMINNPSLKGSSRNEHGGIVLRGGVDPDLDESASKWDTNYMRRDNNCVPDDGKHKFEAHGTGEQDYYFFKGWAKVAQANCLRRISWREIY